MNKQERLKRECSLCKSKERLVRDHCHDSGFIRGILCDLCNTYLGLLESDGKRDFPWKGKHRKWLRKVGRENIDEYLSSQTEYLYRSREGQLLLYLIRRHKGYNHTGTFVKLKPSTEDIISKYQFALNTYREINSK